MTTPLTALVKMFSIVVDVVCAVMLVPILTDPQLTLGRSFERNTLSPWVRLLRLVCYAPLILVRCEVYVCNVLWCLENVL